MELQGSPKPSAAPRAARRAALALPLLLHAAAALAALSAPHAARGAPTPVDASVVLLFASDVEGGAGSPCAQMARRAMETGGRSVNFVVTG